VRTVPAMLDRSVAVLILAYQRGRFVAEMATMHQREATAAKTAGIVLRDGLVVGHLIAILMAEHAVVTIATQSQEGCAARVVDRV